MNTSARLIGIAAMALACRLAEAPAMAQNALGNGDVLDANPSLTGPNNSGLPVQDYRSRNLLITGNVVGGRGFQGSVGYRAEGDFFAPLGSDDLYRFRADSALSSLDYLNLGRSYDRLSVGQDFRLLEYKPSAATASGRTIGEPLPRSGEVFDTSLTAAATQRAIPAIDAQMRLDRIASSIMSYNVLSSEAESDPIGWVYDREGRAFLATSSSLRGLQYQPPQLASSLAGLSSLDLARSFDDYLSGVRSKPGSPFDWGFQSLETPPPPADTSKPPGFVDPRIGTFAPVATALGYRNILESVVKRYGEQEQSQGMQPESLKGLEDRLQSLRRELGAGTMSVPSGLPAPEEANENQGDAIAKPGLDPSLPFLQPDASDSSGSARSTPTLPDLDARGSSVPGSSPVLPTLGDGKPSSALPDSSTGALPKLPEPLTGSAPTTPQLDPGMETSDADAIVLPSAADLRDMGTVLRHGQTLSTLLAGDGSRFNELMSAGEQAMGKTEYFFAERKFTQALRYTPGHPLAIAGVANAQIGAGLYLSAALTVRSLFARSPEMIDTRYEAALLPTPQRIESAVTALRQRMDDTRVRVTDRASAALLLAYLGHQTRDLDMARQGLDAMSRLTPDDPLAALLRSIWLSSDQPEPQPAAPAQPAQTEQPSK